MKRVVILTWKDGRAPMQVYKTATELLRDNKPSINLCIGALWNALSKGNGVYENKTCRIEFKDLR